MSRRTLKYILYMTLAVMVMCLWGGCSNTQKPFPLAQHGVIDLSQVDFTQTSVSLNGQWEFYWKKLLSPKDFNGLHPPVISTYLNLPREWNGVRVDGKIIGGTGFATFRLRVISGTSSDHLALHLDNIESSYRLWINGVLASENGVIGTSAHDEIPNRSPRLIKLPATQFFDVVLQVSNYHYRDGGVVSTIKIGSDDRLETEQIWQRGGLLFCLGAILVMGFYHLAFFFFRKKNIAPLYFAIYCLLWGGYLLYSNSNDWFIRILLQRMPVAFLNRADLLCFILSVPVGYIFLRTLYPEEFSCVLQKVIWIFALVFVVLGIVLPTMTFTSILPVYYFFSMAMISYTLAMLFRAMFRDRQEAFFIFSGFFLLGSAGVNDMLTDLQVIRSVYIIQFGLLAFILFQGLALSLRFSRAFTAVENLSDELAEKNRSLKDEIAGKIRLEREIVSVSDDERRRISYELHDGLCQLLTGARLHFFVLRNKFLGMAEEKEWQSLASLLEDSVNQSYDLSRGLWPVDHSHQKINLAFEELALRLSETSGVEIESSQKYGCERCTNPDVNQVYRIAQEAITNAIRHARASKIFVRVDCGDHRTISLLVRDNGGGRNQCERSKGGLGIRIMSHRAAILGGCLKISDAIDGGTMVSCTIPCEVMRKEG